MFNFGEAQIAPRKTESGDISFSRSIVGLRQDRGITLQECARLTGVSASTWSKIERGELSPTVTTLQKIAVGLGIEMGDLLASTRTGALAQGRRAVSRNSHGKDHASKTCKNTLLCHELKDKRMVPVRSTVTARSSDEYAEWAQSDAEIFLYVVSGHMQLHTKIYEPLELKAGDSVYYDAQGEHCWTSVGDEDAVVLWVVTS
ncbi:MAG: XRE family transcriptional regulator [Tepidamorphaceae bacterium]|nr:helix-turn-helix domain-containing protein [Rhodobiaceae bacterium]MCC0048629.1 helix-turn-helix transcriptional regulator [Rhodobiaceae bacterium]